MCILRRVILIASIFLFASSIAMSQEKNLGIGIVIGSPTGLSAKLFLSENNALDFDLAFDIIHGGLVLTADYLYHFNDLLDSPDVSIRPYIGGGGVVGTRKYKDDDSDGRKNGDDDDKVETVIGVVARFTGGVSFLFTNVPIELFIDLSPGIWLFPATDIYLGGVIGARYFF